MTQWSGQVKLEVRDCLLASVLVYTRRWPLRARMAADTHTYVDYELPRIPKEPWVRDTFATRDTGRRCRRTRSEKQSEQACDWGAWPMLVQEREAGRMGGTLRRAVSTRYLLGNSTLGRIGVCRCQRTPRGPSQASVSFTFCCLFPPWSVA